MRRAGEAGDDGLLVTTTDALEICLSLEWIGVLRIFLNSLEN